MKVAIAVPRRADGARRDEVWAWCRQWWETNTPWPIHEGTDHGTGKFNRSAACNRAAEVAGDWDVAVFLDSDVVLGNPRSAFLAVETAARTGRWTSAQDRWRGLTRVGSDRIMSGWVGDWGAHVRTHIHMSSSSCVAVPRPLWEELGGYDERCIGWGFEDVAFMWAAQALGGGLEREHGDLFHLWHPRSPERDEHAPEFQANKRLSRLYRARRCDRAATLELLAQRAAA